MCVWPRNTNTRPKGAHSQCWNGQAWAAADLGDMEIRYQPKRVVGLRIKNPRVSESEARRNKFLEDVRTNGSIQHACDAVPVSYNAYAKWRKQYPQFAAEVDLARGIARGDRIIYTADFATFRRNYFGMETTWFQHMAVQALDDAKQGEIVLLLWPPEHGKLVADSELLPTLEYADGVQTDSKAVPTWVGFKKAADVVIGDHLFGRDGRPTKVTAIYPEPEPELRRVTFVDGTHLDVCVDHNWFIRDRGRKTQGRDWQGVMTTAEMEAVPDYRRRLSVPLCGPLQLPERDLPIDPWLLGYWLGNGGHKSNALHTHGDDLDYVAARCRALAFDCSTLRPRPLSGTVRLRAWTSRLKTLGVFGNKHVPEAYLWASERQRRALLAGLLDSDGYSGGVRGQVELCFTNRELANGAETIVRSLGIKVRRVEGPAGYDGKITGTRYRLIWTMHKCLFQSPRKVAMCRPSEPQGERLKWRYVERIEPIDSAPGRCFTVDADDHLYLAGEQLIVTHNTSLIEDFIGYKLALDAHVRITVVSERKEHATKILRRVKNRMEPDGPCPDYVHKFGPFAPAEKDGKRAGAQPWANDHFDVRLRGTFDERDFSCAAVGVNTAIQGQRADWLIIDDCQSLKSLNLTADYVDKLRQDFFSRPGMFGRICLLGTRVGNEDVYEELIEAGLIDRLIVFPAYRDTATGEREWLWPERYTPEMYEGMRKRVGEQAWARNYMQRPSAAKDSTFDREMIAGCHNLARSVIADCPREGNNMTRVCVSLDPSLGNANAITALGFHTKRLLYLSSRVDYGLTRNEQIFDLLEQTVIRWNNPGVSRVHEIVIEANAFQRGLLDDDRIREIIRRYGVRVVPHITGSQKNDPDIGVPSMALSFMRGEIDLPFSDKPSRDEVALFTEELCAWRPFRRGNILRQDRVMSFWFGFLRWRSQRMVTHVEPGQFSSKGSPLRVSA